MHIAMLKAEVMLEAGLGSLRSNINLQGLRPLPRQQVIAYGHAGGLMAKALSGEQNPHPEALWGRNASNSQLTSC